MSDDIREKLHTELKWVYKNNAFVARELEDALMALFTEEVDKRIKEARIEKGIEVHSQWMAVTSKADTSIKARIDETNKWALKIVECKNPLDLPQHVYDYHQTRIKLLNAQLTSLNQAQKEGYDINRKGSWIFIGDKAGLENLDDLYWSYVQEYVAKDNPYRTESYEKLEYIKKNMASASFSSVGIHKLLAVADQNAKERLATLKAQKEES